MATILDVAKYAGVSPMTVSRVLRGEAGVREEKKALVREAVKKLHYQPNLSARAMRSNQSHMIGILIPNFSNPFYCELAQTLEEMLGEEGYDLLISFSKKDESQIESLKYLISRNVDAMIVSSYSDPSMMYEHIKEYHKELPTVFLDKVPLTENIYSVYADGYDGITQMMNYLIEKGHRRIALIASELNYDVPNQRLRAYHDAMEKNGLEIQKGYVYSGDFTLKSGRMAAKSFLALPERPTAILAINDFMATGALQYLTDHGISVPDEIAVGGYDGIYVGGLTRPKLTSFGVNIEEMAKAIVGRLIGHLKNGEAEHTPCVIQGELIRRDSI